MTGVPAAVTGLGLVTPAGIGVPQSWAGICAGRGAGRTDASLAPSPVQLVCRVPGFDAEAALGAERARRTARFGQFALTATAEALADAGLDPATWDGTRVGMVLGNAMGGLDVCLPAQETMLSRGARAVSPLVLPQYLSNMAAGQTAIAHGITGPCLTVSTACASGTSAIGVALDLLRAGRCDIVVAGGAEAPLTALTATGFAQLGALSRAKDPRSASRPFDARRDGFVLAEGAGMLVLEREEHALARGARVRARIAGHGETADAHHMVAPHPEGLGLQRAMRGALADAGVSPSEVDHVNAHATGTPRGDAAEALALVKVFPHRPPVTSVKGVIGHSLGAAGAIEAVCSVLSIEHRTIPGTANLHDTDPEIDLQLVRSTTSAPVTTVVTHSVGFGGQNAALVVTAP
ncbi:beta-ketoacyl-[acyl-carrier-protein] synthase family protein [Streptomyces sp. NPDC048111]|uniref:beta-ketoacyl-[acyl-carrier-protein] synthase family protein n=1 Tax=Streptomyces sp. NPDC048111 TaxID=3365500 RepID=UPI003717A069